tara:strand:+ start:4248 stop:4667 length:420 start_codon:yes stop_codon:yes gene_type:complete
LKSEQEIVEQLNKLYPKMQPLILATDPFCSYDASNSKYIVEIKSRDTQYPSWIIEREKFAANVDVAVETGKQFVYLTEYNGKIITWNINRLIKNINFSLEWEQKLMPATTEFENNNAVFKQVGHLYESDGRIHTEEETL